VFVYQYPELTLQDIDTMQLQPMIQTSHQRSNHFTFFRFVKDQTAFCQKDQAQATVSLCLRLFSSVSFGGGRRDRTDDPLLAKQVLSQLSYAPSSYSGAARQSLGGSGRNRTYDPRLIKTVL
jgi:hypothetical protein